MHGQKNIKKTNFVMSFVDQTIGFAGGIVNFSFTTTFLPALTFTREH